ncbi:MAG: hypothetical protein JRE63_04995 [Deltaproteobacteria bacterium]|jgi:hypothetical protein|nr:hypothetical protein [Deltaproteobacteria bacterium]
MPEKDTHKVRLKISPQVARIVGSGAPRELQLSAAQGALDLCSKDLLVTLYLLCHSDDLETRTQAVATLKKLPKSELKSLAQDTAIDPVVLDLLARVTIDDPEVMDSLIKHEKISDRTLLFIAKRGNREALEVLFATHQRLADSDGFLDAIMANPHAAERLKRSIADTDNADVPKGGTQVDELIKDTSLCNASKYQIALDLPVTEKIKVGLSGDKEWRSILIKDSNKLVQNAVLKNPRITEAEVLMIAKNKSSSDDLIRQILVNRDWVKLYEIKKALAVHPKTPLPRAMRLISVLSNKDIKDLMRSKNVSTVLSTLARKEFERRSKRES